MDARAALDGKPRHSSAPYLRGAVYREARAGHAIRHAWKNSGAACRARAKHICTRDARGSRVQAHPRWRPLQAPRMCNCVAAEPFCHV
eukprot:13096486-Alexandrium_andersonii.AAC.1